MNEYMNRVALQIFRYFNTVNGRPEAEPERFYHGFVLGLLVELEGRYILTSNRESGFGRYDVTLEPVYPEKDEAVILEFKAFNKRKEASLEETLQAAFNQMKDKQYGQALIAGGIPEEDIHYYGIAFKGKEVLIGSM